MADLSKQKCVPCEGGTEPLKRDQFILYLEQVPNWNVIEDQKLERQFEFKNFRAAIGFVTQVALVAEKEGHHPDIHLHDYKLVTITLSTHSIGGLSTNDFILATKIDQI